MKRLEEEQAEEDRASGRGQNPLPNMKRPSGVPPDKKQSNFTDPESGLMKTASGGFEQCYNAQLAVDAEKQIVVAADVTGCAADNGQLLPMEEQAEKNTGQKTDFVLADSGYKGEASFEAMEQRGVDACVSLGKGEGLGSGSAAPCTQRMDAKMRGANRAASDSSDARRSSTQSTGGSRTCSAFAPSRCAGSPRPRASGA